MPGHQEETSALSSELEELQRRLETSERHTAQTLARATRLAQVIAVLAHDTELEEMPSRAVTEVANLFSADVGALLLGNGALRLEGHWGLGADQLPPAPVAVSPTVGELSTTEPVRVGPAADVGVPQWLDVHEVEHAAWIRLMVGADQLGVMFLGRRAPEPFEPSDAQELRAIAYRIALAIENGHLQRGLRRQLELLRRLHELTSELAGKLALDDVATSVAQTVAREIGAGAVAVYVAEGPGELRAIARAGAGDAPPQISSAPPDAVLSLESGSDRVGAIVLTCPPEEGSEKRAVLEHVADLAGLALQKAILYERTREQARRDSLTGLLGHRAFHEELEHGLHNGLQEQGFSLALVDIDDFKQINDVYGHPAGDETLRAVAEALRASVRHGDSVFRVGGEEFCIVMPGLGGKDSLLVAERVRAAVAALDGEVPMTVSVGIASYPADAGDREGLVARADAALYAAKRSGKNRAILAVEAATDASDRRTRGQRGGIGALLNQLQSNDPYAAAHSARVTALTVEVGRRLGIDGDALDDLRLAAEFHDLGKLGVPAAILGKPAALTAVEYEVIKTHAAVGAALLEACGLRRPACFVHQHHEHFDGSGYPTGLSGDEITLEARILHATDAYTAMTLDRPYRKAMSDTAALEELRRHSGTQFDPVIVVALVAALDSVG